MCEACTPRGPSHINILVTGDWGGGGPSDFLGLQILAKSDFFWSMKDTRPGFFWGREKKWRFSWVAKKGLRDFFG